MSVDIEVEVIVECEDCGYELDANYEMRYRNNARRPVLIVKPCERCLDDATDKERKKHD